MLLGRSGRSAEPFVLQGLVDLPLHGFVLERRGGGSLLLSSSLLLSISLRTTPSSLNPDLMLEPTKAFWIQQHS